MGIPKSFPIRCTFKGISDAYDSTDKFPGACRAITDLIFDQSNPEILVSRPGVSQQTDFTGFVTPGFVSLHATIGTRIYGMLATGRTAGFDEPFCYDVATSAFIAITGVTGANVPASPATTGAWVPPTIAQVGVRIIITHPGFSGAGTNFFGVIDVTNPAAPAWSANNLTTNALTAVPSAVANYNNRAYFAVGNVLPYSDVLTLVRTNASQQLTIGDSGLITALSGLPLTTTSDGILAALVIWKANQVWQVTGDTTASTLALNFMSLNVGSSAPRSIALSPYGIYFASNAGPYFIDPVGTLRAVTNDITRDRDPDIQAPFINATQPSRIAAAYAGSVYRVCLDTIVNGVAATNDYWFDEHRRRWTGPHSFPYACASAIGNIFYLSDNNNPGKMMKSQSSQDTSSAFTDLGTTLTAQVLTATFPKTGRMTEKQVVESTQELSASGGSVTYNITAQDEQGNTLGIVAIAIAPGGNIWGSNIWGDGSKWANSNKIPHVYSLAWSAPLVFKKMAILISAVASANLQIGTHFARYQDCGYMNLTAANTP